MQFGDGIQSMIDCQVTVDKKEDPKGDRVVVTFECVFSAVSCVRDPSSRPSQRQIPQVLSMVKYL